MKTAEGDAILKQFIEKDQLFHFLMGLDPGSRSSLGTETTFQHQ